MTTSTEKFSSESENSTYVDNKQYILPDFGYFNYTGQIQNGEAHGNGTGKYFKTGETTPLFTYSGQWENSQRHGFGEEYYQSGAYYFGNWKEGEMSGNGTIIYSDGRKYVGPFKNGLKHTEGKL
jgi:hypothetical protein